VASAQVTSTPVPFENVNLNVRWFFFAGREESQVECEISLGLPLQQSPGGRIPCGQVLVPEERADALGPAPG